MTNNKDEDNTDNVDVEQSCREKKTKQTPPLVDEAAHKKVSPTPKYELTKIRDQNNNMSRKTKTKAFTTEREEEIAWVIIPREKLKKERKVNELPMN